MTDRHPVWQLLDRIQMDARALDSRVSELRREMLAFELKAETGSALVCDVCGIGAGLHAADCQEAPEPAGDLHRDAARRDPPPWLMRQVAAPAHSVAYEISYGRVPVTDERTDTK